jgi:hypothetical protein
VGSSHHLKEPYSVAKFIVTLLAVLTLAMPSMAVAQLANEEAKAIQTFSSSIKSEGGPLQVILLTDRTIEALFPKSPSKVAFRTKARMAAVFWIQGVASKDFDFKPEATLVQKGQTLQGQPTPVSKNFLAGHIAKGETLQGLIEFPKQIDLNQPFKLTVNGQSTEFNLDPGDVREYGNSK